MKVICARLITGEELIAKVVENESKLIGSGQYAVRSEGPFDGAVWDIPETSDAIVTLEDARIVTLQQVPGRGMGISFIPYTMSNPDTKVRLDLRKHAMSVYPPEQNLERAYIGENSQIQLATPESARMQGIKVQ